MAEESGILSKNSADPQTPLFSLLAPPGTAVHSGHGLAPPRGSGTRVENKPSFCPNRFQSGPVGFEPPAVQQEMFGESRYFFRWNVDCFSQSRTASVTAIPCQPFWPPYTSTVLIEKLLKREDGS